ncbi:MAG TPA: hypothetical protein VGR09_14740, partial [Gemmatimonadales bacterium]|nr:hypothetical protein [Gemmatimonadales bacterium]
AVLQYAEIFERNRNNKLGDECALKLGFLAFVVNRRNPRAMTEERALAYAQEAQRRHPDNAEIATTLGHLCQRAGLLDEAVQQEEAALSLAPDPERTEELQWMLGLSLVGMGQVGRARSFFEAAARSTATPWGESTYRVLSRLYIGDYANGWPELDAYLTNRGMSARYKSGKKVRATYPWRPWNGEPLEGRLLLDAETWGYGDSLMWARWIPTVRARVGALTLMVHPTLVRFFGDHFRDVTVVDTVEAGGGFERWTRNYSLPPLLGVQTPADIPSEPYLRATEPFRPLAGDFRVGIVWAGSADHSNDVPRSTPLAAWDPVLRVPGVTFYSLQVGPASEQLREVGGVYDLEPELTDWARTAAAVKELDLVITVDTAVAHLAGALGAPTWICLATPSEYRWMLSGATTHWYQSARLFRQPTAGDWESVFAEVARALRERLDTYSEALYSGVGASSKTARRRRNGSRISRGGSATRSTGAPVQCEGGSPRLPRSTRAVSDRRAADRSGCCTLRCTTSAVSSPSRRRRTAAT